ncbi:MAG TPA: Fic family protein [Candidatus Phocaeicola merdavium]|nr:Fic family protein [Candidatus Phocaeicola merdavium]
MSKEKYSGYAPPFTVSSRAISLVAEISAQIERYAIRMEQADGLRLRKANKIRTIHSSLAIEGNRLSENQVHDILEGKHVVAPLREIQEVKNAIRTYELYASLNPFDMKDLLKAHGVMMEALVDNPGCFRNSGVGVFEGDRCVHLAPPPMRVPKLMEDLFCWLKHAPDHLLIRSCVFHYEFEFIHPFSDGNGRMGRLWQSLILGRLNPVFEHLPIENLVYANQQLYYEAIESSTQQADCGPFIDFMLNEILNALKKYQGEPLIPDVPDKIPNKVPDKLKLLHPEFSDTTWDVLAHIIDNPQVTAVGIGKRMTISDRMVRKHIALLRNANIICRHGSNKSGYWELLNEKEDEV